MGRRLLCVDDEEVIRVTLSAILSHHGFEVTTAATVGEALQLITSEQFDVLLSDLNIGNAGDGLTLVSAMRRTQPHAVTLILTGYPAFETALEAIRQQVDDYIVKPANIPALLSTIESKLTAPARTRQLPPAKRIAMLLQEQKTQIEKTWLSLAEQDKFLSMDPPSREKSVQRLRLRLEDVIRSAQSYSGDAAYHRPAVALTSKRHSTEEYTAEVTLTEICLLRRAIAHIVQENLLAVNLSYLVPDLARVNETLDEQALATIKALSAVVHSNNLTDPKN